MIITNFKIFENKNDKLEVGDYVLIQPSITNIIDKKIILSKEFVQTHVGKCIRIFNIGIYKDVVILYKNIPNEITSYFNIIEHKNNENIGTRTFDVDRVVAYSKKIEDLEIIINAKKYNL